MAEIDERNRDRRDGGEALHTKDLLERPDGRGDTKQQDRGADDPGAPPLLGERTGELREQWERIQASFVDEPRGAVEQADALVATVMRQLAETFAAERDELEQQWSDSGEASTESLRIALQRYRDFFHRLLSA